MSNHDSSWIENGTVNSRQTLRHQKVGLQSVAFFGLQATVGAVRKQDCIRFCTCELLAKWRNFVFHKFVIWKHIHWTEQTECIMEPFESWKMAQRVRNERIFWKPLMASLLRVHLNFHGHIVVAKQICNCTSPSIVQQRSLLGKKTVLVSGAKIQMRKATVRLRRKQSLSSQIEGFRNLCTMLHVENGCLDWRCAFIRRSSIHWKPQNFPVWAALTAQKVHMLTKLRELQGCLHLTAMKNTVSPLLSLQW